MTEQKQSKELKERKGVFTTTVDGTVVKRLYTSADLEEIGMEELPPPGEYPFTRHIMPTGYRGRLGVFDVTSIDDEIRKTLLDTQMSFGKLKTEGDAKFRATLHKQGMKLVFGGRTTMSEVKKISTNLG